MLRVRYRHMNTQSPASETSSSNPHEAENVEHHLRLEAKTVYAIISAEGEDELARPNQSIFWSSIAAGLAISFSVIIEAALRANLPDTPMRHVFENFGYTAGFLIVILCRLQLFTENTITPVLPVLKNRDMKTFNKTAVLWGVCFVGNMIGALIIALALNHVPMLSGEVMSAIDGLADHVAEITASHSLARGIPAGFLIAALVWMMPSSEGNEFWVIFFVTYLIALGDFTHVIAGSVELFYIGVADLSRMPDLIIGNLIPTLIGNVIGGTGLFALIAWAQVEAEMNTTD